MRCLSPAWLGSWGATGGHVGRGLLHEQVWTSTQTRAYAHISVQAHVMREDTLASQRPTRLPQTRAPVPAHAHRHPPCEPARGWALTPLPGVLVRGFEVQAIPFHPGARHRT